MSWMEGVYALWLREVKVFMRERSRIVTSIFTPMLWIFVFGGGLGSTVEVKGLNYQVYIYPGILAMSVLFSSV
ncbi:MAG: ABC transporter, partial [Candidatus Bathyarchaeia archaeon]